MIASRAHIILACASIPSTPTLWSAGLPGGSPNGSVVMLKLPLNADGNSELGGWVSRGGILKQPM